MMKKLICALVALCLADALHAQSFDAPTAFGARRSILDLALSPDGRRVAFIAPTSGQGTAVLTLALDRSAKPVVAASSDSSLRFTSCSWVSNDRLTCQAYFLQKSPVGAVLAASRLVAFDAAGGALKVLTADLEDSPHGLLVNGGEIIDWLPEEDGAVLMTREYLRDDNTSRQGSSHGNLGVDRIDTRTLRVSRVESPAAGAAAYITDGHGKVRVMATRQQSADTTAYLYRTSDSSAWSSLGTYHESDRSGFLPLAVDRDLNVAYGLKKLAGHMALYTVKLDGSLHEELVYARPDVDVKDVVRLGRQQRVVGVSLAADMGETHFFDPKLQPLLQSLDIAVTQAELSVSGASLDESRLLLWGSGKSVPGVSYIFDGATHQLNAFLVARTELEGVKLAAVKVVSYPAGDGTAIPAYLTLPPGREDVRGLPAIVMPLGGPASRDSGGFYWLVQFFANRGYAVLQPGYRGSGAYADAWSVGNGPQSWSVAIGDVLAAGRWLVAQGTAAPGKLAIAGWSYGGYAALQSAVVDPELFKAVIAIAPVTDLTLLKEAHRGFSDSQIVSDFAGSGTSPHEGSPDEHAERIKAPVLLFHGGMDLDVSIEESRLMAARLKAAGRDCELVTWDKLDHQLDDSAARAQMLRTSDEFLRKALGL